MSKRKITPQQYFLEGYRRCIRNERFVEADITARRASAISAKGSWRVAREYTKGAGGEDHIEAAEVMPFGGGENLSMTGVDAYLDLEDEHLRDARANTAAKREEIMGILNDMQDKNFARLLVYRYICEFPPSWEAIAEIMCASRASVLRWHDGALIALMGKIPES